ncbi:MAG: putative Ig domain-containing protein [Burkholderiales bacterium]|nr:putative Ig domain-containing protein [Opitutaceae bacterium]
MFALNAWCSLLAPVFLAGTLHAADLHVATTGNDTTGNGAFATPYRTIQRAANLAVAGDTVLIRAGTYRETVTPANSGTSTSPITYKAYESGGVFENVVISGLDQVSGWTAHDTSNGRAIYKTTAMGWNLSDNSNGVGLVYRNQIFVNSQMQVLARWPNVPYDRITRLTYADLALVSAGSGKTGSTPTSAWIENANVNATFPAGYWNSTRLATARVFLSPSTMIWGMSVKIASQATNRLNLDATGTGFDFIDPNGGSYYHPVANNRFFIYNWYEALDTGGEYWKDIATNTLYLWAPGGADPSTLTVEARRRDFGLSLGSRSYLTFQGIKLFGCTVNSDGFSTHLTFSEIEARYIAHIDNYAVTFNTAANAREFYLRGDGHVVENSYFNGAAVGVIGASGTNMRIENNVIRDFGYGHNGGAIFARNGGIYGNRTLATKNQFLRNTAFNGGHTIVTTDPALDIKYNRIYNSHLRGSDVGAVGIASTDGLGSEIAYNVISDALGPKDTGELYGGFGIYFDFECRNFTVHHNIVFNTTGGSYQFMPIRADKFPAGTNVGIKFYHNTGDSGFGIIEPQAYPGVDVRNNLVRKFGSAGGTYAGLPNVQFSNNTAYGTDAAAPFRDRARGDLRFATGSSTGVNAGTVISPFSDGFVSTAPDTGALEFDLAPFIAGATFTQRQLASLTAASIAQAGAFIDIQLGNLPEGRSPPTTFQAQIGSEAFGGTLAYDYPTSTWRLLGVSKGALTGTQTVSVRLSGTGAAVALESQVDFGDGVPAVTANQSATGYLTTLFNYAIATSGGPTSYALVSGTLPPGVTLNTTTGVFSGTPTTTGIYTPSFTATNALGTSPAVAVTLTILTAPPGTLLTYEGFDYTASASITGLSGGTGWRAPSNSSWASGGTTGTVAASGLSYTAINPSYTAFTPTGLAGNYGGILQNNRLPAIDAGGVYATAGLKASDGNYLGGGTVTGTLWGSFLVAANTWGTASGPQMLFNLDSTAGTGTRVSIRQTGAGSALSVTDTGGGGLGAVGTIPSSSLSTTTPNLIVFRYAFNGAGSDTFDVWLNPEAATDIPAISATAANFVFNNLTLRSVNANGGLVFDEIRLGTSFAVVTPYVETAASALQTFRGTYGLAPDGSQDLLQPAGDGIAHLLKYAFNMLGSGPGQAEDIDLPNAAVLAPDGSAGLPFCSLLPAPGSPLQLTYIRRKAAAYPGIDYAVEWSDTLASWAVNPSATATVTPLDATFERVTVTDSATATDRRFVRLRVTAE